MYQVTIVEEEIAPVTISDIESTGSTTYAVSAVSVSTSNNREEPPPIGKQPIAWLVHSLESLLKYRW